METDNILATNLRKFRRLAKLSQTDIAQKLNVSHQAVSKWESGMTKPDASFLPVIADAFHVSIDMLYGHVLVEDEYLLLHIDEARQENNFKRAEKICRDGLKMYPTSFALRALLASVLLSRFVNPKDKSKKKPNFIRECLSLCDEVLNQKAAAPSVREQASRTLIIACTVTGNAERAVALAREMKKPYDNLLVYVLSGQERIAECASDINEHAAIIQTRLRQISKAYEELGDKALARKFKIKADIFTSPADNY